MGQRRIGMMLQAFRNDLRATPGVFLILLLSACASVPPVQRAEFVQALQGADIVRLEAMLATGGAPLQATTPDGKTALMVLAGAGRADAVADLLEAGMLVSQANQRGGTALMFAAVSGEPEVVNQLLSAGADANAVARNGWTAIALAAAKGYTSVVQALLAAGADPNIPDMYGWTPLMRAVEHGRLATVQLLLEVPAIDIDAVNDQGASALFRATVTEQAELIGVLLAHGADPDLEDFEGRTPAAAARLIDRDDLAKLLLRARAGG